MTHITTLFSWSDLFTALDEGLVHEQRHPELPYRILNYTGKAPVTKGAFDNPAVGQCRGLIINEQNRIIARPFQKFFNYGEPGAPEVNPFQSQACECFDKIDGSLGILYHTGRGRTLEGLWYSAEFAIATRGGFQSEQAIHATKIWQEKYQDSWVPKADYTALFEIVYPENRIVVDYEDMDDLVLLGLVHIPTGKIVGPRYVKWPGPLPELLPYQNLLSAIKAEPRENAEGMVVYLKDRMLKIKQEDYVKLHRIVTGMNERTIWESLKTKSLEDLLAGLPDEFHTWVTTVADSLKSELTATYYKVIRTHKSILATHTKGTQKAAMLDYIRCPVCFYEKGTEFTRKNYALHATRWGGITPYLFMVLDGKDPQPAIWESLKPEANKPFQRQT